LYAQLQGPDAEPHRAPQYTTSRPLYQARGTSPPHAAGYLPSWTPTLCLFPSNTSIASTPLRKFSSRRFLFLRSLRSLHTCGIVPFFSLPSCRSFWCSKPPPPCVKLPLFTSPAACPPFFFCIGTANPLLSRLLRPP